MEKLNLICVDDQREVLSAVLQDLAPLKTWVNIEECESADEALDLLDELDSEGGYIALVISDHIMPGKNGVELLTDVSHDYRFLRTKKVLLTGQATHQDTITAINRARIESYIEKPWNASELLALATRLITEYIFDKGLEYTDYQEHLDQQVVLDRLR
ncbi:response regulator [Aliivibrio fischeri]|uniref:ScrF protein n=3 Tax=Aliivibrio fischeri TaxID=668 RepID=Q5E5Z7_ALIF1|nr:response regulator [Aliivibrio fischeri]AAW85549.1 ScrF protein [Aliivibrio fischeri ES114]ACH66737.1 chemotaxis protein CheY [Aliivibrio fischeri MJ11]KLU80174.1 chemotaxis protein CheY [Aliivibrio fischeri]MBP3141620.1 response regulator [Aliivibrio fischeri]MBP3157760.1 response regulator [Aliivibrio fischeri]